MTNKREKKKNQTNHPFSGVSCDVFGFLCSSHSPRPPHFLSNPLGRAPNTTAPSQITDPVHWEEGPKLGRDLFDCTDSDPTTRRVREGTSRTGTPGDHGKESLMTGKKYQDEFHVRSWLHIPHAHHTAGQRIPSSKRRCVLTPHKDLSGGTGAVGGAGSREGARAEQDADLTGRC